MEEAGLAASMTALVVVDVADVVADAVTDAADTVEARKSSSTCSRLGVQGRLYALEPTEALSAAHFLRFASQIDVSWVEFVPEKG